MCVAMSIPLSTLFDAILDHATRTAILAAEQDYPLSLTPKDIADQSVLHGQEALIILGSDEPHKFLTMYTGTYIAAYHRRMRALVAHPIGSHHQHSL